MQPPSASFSPDARHRVNIRIPKDMMSINRRSRNTEPPAATKYDNDVDDELDEDTEEDEEEATRRSRGRRDSSRPAGRRSSARESDRRPAGRGSGRSTGTRRAGGGWDAVKAAKSGDYAENLKIGDDEVLIKFLEAEPYVVYRQHWLQEAEGRKSFTCLEDDCPLCDVLGDRPNTRVLFNVIDLSDGQRPEVKTWSMGIRLAEKVELLSTKPRTTPIDRTDLYWAVSRSGKGTRTEYNLEPIKAESADDLEDWGVEPLDAEEIAEMREKAAGADSVRWDSREDLEEIADDLS